MKSEQSIRIAISLKRSKGFPEMRISIKLILSIWQVSGKCKLRHKYLFYLVSQNSARRIAEFSIITRDYLDCMYSYMEVPLHYDISTKVSYNLSSNANQENTTANNLPQRVPTNLSKY